MDEFLSIDKRFIIFLILLLSPGTWFKISPECYAAQQSNIGRYRDFLETVKSGNIEMAKLLYEEGIDINGCYEYWETPLMIAVAAGTTNDQWSPIHRKLAEWLLSHGADVNLRHPKLTYGTPLLTAIMKGSHEAVKFLIERGADVNAVAEGGDSPFALAALRCDCNLANLLISKGANINLWNKNNDTPLANFVYCAMQRDPKNRQSHIKMVRFLLDKGADPEFRPVGHVSAVEAARSQQDIELYKMLRASKKQPTPQP